MSVSGLGSARTPRTAATPTHRPARVEKPSERSDFDQLTAADRALIAQSTGHPQLDFALDPARDATGAFAAALAAERASGRLAPGQEITSVYLKDLSRRYERAGGVNPITGHLDRALAYLDGAGGGRRFDVSA